MSGTLAQRATIAALLCATLAAAVVAYVAPKHAVDSRRAARVREARQAIQSGLHGRVYYLEDVADMVGVHDDADAKEFSRYSHVRARDDRSIVGVQWLRRSPSGKLLPPHDVGAEPMLIQVPGPNAPLARATSRAAATPAIAAASAKRVALSQPVRLANGRAAFYLAVPVEARRFSGELSRAESRSAIVGLVDPQALVAQALAGDRLHDLRLSDGQTALASSGSKIDDPARAVIPAGGRRWVVTVEGGSLTPREQALPWLTLALGLGLTLAVALLLRRAVRNRELALELARERSSELAHSTAMIQRITSAIDECFYTYTLDEDGRATTRFATPGWSRVLGRRADTGDAVSTWEHAVHPDDRAAFAAARERVRAGEPTDLEFRVLDSRGAVRWLWTREHPIGGEDGDLVVDGVVSDISARKAAEGALEQAHAEAERLSRIDVLTGVFNRRHFGDLLARELERNPQQPPAVLLLDLDHFKSINDEHGHLTGDAVLRAAAQRVESVLRGEDCLARWGGEEFAILSIGADRTSVALLAERVRRALAERPVQIEDMSIALTASIGAAIAGEELATPDALLDAADRALYEAKRAGRDGVRVWSDRRLHADGAHLRG
jgi:diguanylate cyclase (GGDEF)-like protein/PAS domain S-box-containing protein